MVYPVIYLVWLGASAWLFTWGLYLLLQPALQYSGALFRTERRHRLKLDDALRESFPQPKPGRALQLVQSARRELELLLKATLGERYTPSSVQRFLLITASCSLSAGTLGCMTASDLRFGFFAGGITLVLPVLVCRLKLRSLQIQSGYDLAEAVGILTSKYKVTRGNMRTALQLASQEIASAPIRRHFMNLLRKEMNYVESRELEMAVEEFIYSIQTSFAKQLGLTVLKGLLRNENVESTLMAIDKNIHKQIDMLRDEGDSSSEVLQLSWLHLLLFPLLLAMMVVFMGINSTLHYQLETEQGRFWLMVTLSFIAGSLLLAIWFRRPPNDY